MAETTIIKTAEDAPEETTDSAERAIGHLESEVEHHEEALAKHTDTLESLQAENSWINERFRMMEERIATIPNLPAETLSALESRIAKLEEKAEQVTDSTLSLTEPPPQEKNASEEKPKDRNILARLL